MKQKPYNVIGLVFNLLALVCAALFFTTNFVRSYELAFTILMIIAAIFYVLYAFQVFRK